MTSAAPAADRLSPRTSMGRGEEQVPGVVSDKEALSPEANDPLEINGTTATVAPETEGGGPVHGLGVDVDGGDAPATASTDREIVIQSGASDSRGRAFTNETEEMRSRRTNGAPSSGGGALGGGPSSSSSLRPGAVDGVEGEHDDADDDPRGGEGPQHLSEYLSHLKDSQREALSRFYHGAIDAPCQKIALCEQELEEQLSDLNCQQLPFLQFLHDPGSENAGGYDGGDDRGMPRQPPGPRPCEYCNSLPPPGGPGCGKDCPRPNLFFLKKKPPFASADGWDPETEYRIDPYEGMTFLMGQAEGGPAVGLAGEDKEKSGTATSVSGGSDTNSWTAAINAKIAAASYTSPGWMNSFF